MLSSPFLSALPLLALSLRSFALSPTATNTFFPDGDQVGFPGPTATGDEAGAIATAPSIAKVDSVFPLVRPDASDQHGRKSFDVLQHLGFLTPWKSVESFGLPDASPVIPDGYNLVQVHLVHRHGARYPTSGAPPFAFASKLNSTATSSGFNATGPLKFLNTWTYKLGAEILTPFGRSQLFNLGAGFRIKYGTLLNNLQNELVFRTTSEARMLDSALHFAAGFFGVQTYKTEYHQLITIEAAGFNNTLSPYFQCANANNNISSLGSVQGEKWARIYLQPALKRLSQSIQGFDLEITDLIAMQQLCAYETVALGYSSFCNIFTEAEWKGFEYMNDLVGWYGSGPGNPATSAQGIGYVQELVSRLTQTPITEFRTTVNATIVSSNITFPLGQPIYVDATHDTVLTTIFTALNFTSLAANGPLPTDHIPTKQSYFISKVTPFASNLVAQVLTTTSSNEPTHIRFVLNDAVIPLTGVRGCKVNKDGLCEISTFINAMKQRIEEVDFDFDCFGNYTVPIPNTITNGQYPRNLRS